MLSCRILHWHNKNKKEPKKGVKKQDIFPLFSFASLLVDFLSADSLLFPSVFPHFPWLFFLSSQPMEYPINTYNNIMRTVNDFLSYLLSILKL